MAGRKCIWQCIGVHENLWQYVILRMCTMQSHVQKCVAVFQITEFCSWRCASLQHVRHFMSVLISVFLAQECGSPWSYMAHERI